MDQYKIYILRDPINNLIRYVGQTRMSLGVRFNQHLKEKKCYNTHKQGWLNSLKVNGLIPKIELLEVHDNCVDCNNAEIFYIKTFKDIGHKLTNIEAGGGHVLGYKWSEESKKKMSVSHKGKILSKSHRENISKALNNPDTKKRMSIKKMGRIMPDYHRKIISLSNKGVKKSEEHKIKCAMSISKAILQYDLYGNFIKEWHGMTIAKSLGGFSVECISGCCSGKRKTHKGFIWIYKQDNKNIDLKINVLVPVVHKMISQYDLNNNLIRHWNNIAEAKRIGGFNNDKISECCRGDKKTHRGYIWKYK